MRNYRELKVWEKAHQFTLKIYRATATFPKEELYALTSQMRRAAASIPTNIAEGCGRDTDPDMSRFLAIAAGSASEVEYQLLLAYDLQLMRQDDYQALAHEIGEIKRMLYSFIKSLKKE